MLPLELPIEVGLSADERETHVGVLPSGGDGGRYTDRGAMVAAHGIDGYMQRRGHGLGSLGLAAAALAGGTTTAAYSSDAAASALVSSTLRPR